MIGSEKDKLRYLQSYFQNMKLAHRFLLTRVQAEQRSTISLPKEELENILSVISQFITEFEALTE